MGGYCRPQEKTGKYILAVEFYAGIKLYLRRV